MLKNRECILLFLLACTGACSSVHNSEKNSSYSSITRMPNSEKEIEFLIEEHHFKPFLERFNQSCGLAMLQTTNVLKDLMLGRRFTKARFQKIGSLGTPGSNWAIWFGDERDTAGHAFGAGSLKKATLLSEEEKKACEGVIRVYWDFPSW